MISEIKAKYIHFCYQLHIWQDVKFRILFLWKDVLTYLFRCPETHSFSTKSKIFLLCIRWQFFPTLQRGCLLSKRVSWDSRKSKQRKWSDVFQKRQVDINFLLICGTKLRTKSETPMQSPIYYDVSSCETNCEWIRRPREKFIMRNQLM